MLGVILRIGNDGGSRQTPTKISWIALPLAEATKVVITQEFQCSFVKSLITSPLEKVTIYVIFFC